MRNALVFIPPVLVSVAGNAKSWRRFRRVLGTIGPLSRRQLRASGGGGTDEGKTKPSAPLIREVELETKLVCLFVFVRKGREFSLQHEATAVASYNTP